MAKQVSAHKLKVGDTVHVEGKPHEVKFVSAPTRFGSVHVTTADKRTGEEKAHYVDKFHKFDGPSKGGEAKAAGKLTGAALEEAKRESRTASNLANTASGAIGKSTKPEVHEKVAGHHEEAARLARSARNEGLAEIHEGKAKEHRDAAAKLKGGPAAAPAMGDAKKASKLAAFRDADKPDKMGALQQGAKGGSFYLTASGKKVYVKK